MKRIFKKVNAFIKGLIILFKPHTIFGFLRKPMFFGYNTLSLSKWISKQDSKGTYNDFYTSKRDYARRYKLYQHILETKNLADIPIDYLEFGVCQGNSFRWWVNGNKNQDSRFYGFDTFEGLPEAWGMVFKKGDMNAIIPDIDDKRVEFIKGLFQETFIPFTQSHSLKSEKVKVIHLDADLFSSTLYILTSIAPYLKKGDILLFDEFNVPNHEFHAFQCFTQSYYIKTKLLGAVNNYLQVALEITD
ncbi:MAG: class I SAM-dependent methyltransferase [Bacteroidales bacterium]|nr:class I SAM-dependent methyltransferase [Bacteroidales bacterium]